MAAGLGLTGGLAGGLASPTSLARAAPDPAAPANRPLPPPRLEILSKSGHDYTFALHSLSAYAQAELAALGLPGMTLSVTDLDGFAATLSLGWADRERAIPVRPHHRFQIGSISKSFIALTVLSLVDEGRLRLDAPAAALLPDAPWPDAPITLAHLLSHVAGLPDDAPIFPRTPDGRLWSGFAPGSSFSYSNTGYRLLGAMIARATDLPFQAAVATRVRDKLGLQTIAGVIDEARRAEFAVGYWPADQSDDGGELPRSPLEMAYWTPEDNAAGSVGATSGEMAFYIRALARFARGEGAPVLSNALARRFTTPVIAAGEFGPGARYAMGVAVIPVYGEDCLHHTGGMMSFSSSFHADAKEGVAAFASVNARLGAYRPRVTTAYAVRLMRAVRRGQALPPPPDPLAPFRVKAPQAWAGRYVGPSGEFHLVVRGGDLRLAADGVEAATLPVGADRITTDHPRLIRHGLDAVRDNGGIVGLWWGETLYGRDGPRPQPVPAAGLIPLRGVYLNRDPWVGGAEIFARGERLVLAGLGELIAHGDEWRLKQDPGGVERARFDAPLNGVMTRLNVSGADLIRLSV
jgi:CubicO group peptidase (beta-lactamase class C family)